LKSVQSVTQHGIIVNNKFDFFAGKGKLELLNKRVKKYDETGIELSQIESLPKYFSIDNRLCSLKISSMNDLIRVLFLSFGELSSEGIWCRVRPYTIYPLKYIGTSFDFARKNYHI
jgi:hypothetical protein